MTERIGEEGVGRCVFCGSGEEVEEGDDRSLSSSFLFGCRDGGLKWKEMAGRASGCTSRRMCGYSLSWTVSFSYSVGNLEDEDVGDGEENEAQ